MTLTTVGLTNKESLLKSLVVAIGTALVLDFIWIGLIAPQFYRSHIGPLLRLKENGGLDPVIWAAAVVYLCIPLGVILFTLPKVGPEDGWMTALAWGFVYGILLYGVYDFTNLALLKGWTVTVTLVDVLWGGVLCALTTLSVSTFGR